MSHGLDDEFELEDFMCIDEEEDTDEQQLSTGEASFLRGKRFDRDRDAERYGRPSEVFSVDPSSWKTRSRFWHGRDSQRAMSFIPSWKRVGSPILKSRHPDYNAYLERRNRERDKIARMGETSRKGESRSGNSVSDCEESIERNDERRIADVRNISEEFTLEEVDCCDSDEEGVYAAMDESNELHTTFDGASQSADSSKLAASGSLKEGNDCGTTHDDPLWAYEEDWPDLLGEVDEEAVRKAASQPVTIENNLMLITPQLSTTSDEHQSSRADSTAASWSGHRADSRIESKRKEQKPSDGFEREESKRVANPERVSSLELWSRHSSSPFTYQRRDSKGDVERPFGSLHWRGSHRMRPRFQKPARRMFLAEVPQCSFRGHQSHSIQMDDGPLFHRSSHLKGSLKQKANKGDTSKESSTLMKKAIPQKMINKNEATSAHHKHASHLLKHSSPSNDVRNKVEMMHSSRTVPAPSSYLPKPSSHAGPTVTLRQSSILYGSEKGNTRNDNLKKSDVAVVITNKQLAFENTERTPIPERTERNIPLNLKQRTAIDEMSTAVPGEQKNELKVDKTNRTLVRPKVTKLSENAVSARTSKGHNNAKPEPLVIPALTRIVSASPPSSSTVSSLNRKFPHPMRLLSVIKNGDAEAVTFHKRTETKPPARSHFSVVQRNGVKAENISRTVDNVPNICPQKGEISSASSRSFGAERTVLPIQEAKSEHQQKTVTMRPVMTATAKPVSTDEEGAVQSKKPRWTLTTVSATTSSISDKMSSAVSASTIRHSTIGQVPQRDSTVARIASLNRRSSGASSAPKKIKLRLPSLSAA